MRTIAPSRISAWEGTPVEGSRYTAEQLRAIEADRRGREQFAKNANCLIADRAVKIRTARSGWTPPTETTVHCPIISVSRDGSRVLVITPAGWKHWMDAERGPA